MMKNFFKLTATFSVASVVAFGDQADLDEEVVETSRNYLRFLTKKYRTMAKTETQGRMPYEERLLKLRSLMSHGSACNTSSGSNGSNASNASGCANGTTTNATTNATTKAATKAATTKAATTKAATTKAAVTTKAPTTAAPTSNSGVLDDVVITVTVDVSVILAVLPDAEGQTEISNAVNTLTATRAFAKTYNAESGSCSLTFTNVTNVTDVTDVTATRQQRRRLAGAKMDMAWTVVFRTADLTAAKAKVKAAKAKADKQADGDNGDFLTLMNNAMTAAGITKLVPTIKASDVTVSKEIAIEVKSESGAFETVKATGSNFQSVLDAAIAKVNATTGAATTKAAAAADADADADAATFSGAFEKTAFATVLLAIASSAVL